MYVTSLTVVYVFLNGFLEINVDPVQMWNQLITCSRECHILKSINN